MPILQLLTASLASLCCCTPSSFCMTFLRLAIPSVLPGGGGGLSQPGQPVTPCSVLLLPPLAFSLPAEVFICVRAGPFILTWEVECYHRVSWRLLRKLHMSRTTVDRHAMGGRTVRCARVPALCEKLAVLHHREFGEFRRLKGRH